MTEPYSDSEYGPRRVSATLHTKPDRADTIEEFLLVDETNL
jgi:hypothetical protein